MARRSAPTPAPATTSTPLQERCRRLQGYAVDDASEEPRARRVVDVLPGGAVRAELSARLFEAMDSLGVKIDWEPVDLAFNDNLSNAHLACPETHADPANAGLRLLLRQCLRAQTISETVPQKADGRKSWYLDL